MSTNRARPARPRKPDADPTAAQARRVTPADDEVRGDALEAAHKRYRDLLESLPVVVYEADFGADGAWRYVSPQIEILLGFPARAWIEDPSLWFRRIHAEDRQLVLAQEHALRAKPPGERVACEYRMITRSSETVWVRDDAVVVAAQQKDDVHMRGVIVDVSERKDLEAKLSRHAFYDGLTGLPNRALFIDRLERAIAQRARRTRGMVAVLFIDVDDFKLVNDTLGHAAGDALLSELGARLASVLGPLDTAARFAGDEFTILLDDLRGPDEALQVAARIAQVVSEPVRVADREVAVTVSVGIGVGEGPNLTAYDLVSQADIAMYRAKENGKARAELFDAEMSAEAWRRLDLQRDLRHAFERNELSVVYQPVVDLVTGRLTQVEALARWEHPERGLLLPADFIPFAESTGLVSQIDRFVLSEACRQLADWHRRHPAAAALSVAVNLSSRDFRHTSLADEVKAVLDGAELPAESLYIEITESAALANAGMAAETIDRLGELGVRVSIDDFGVGYSGLDHFKRLRLHGLKIDRSFVAGLAAQREDRAIVTAALAFGRALGLSVVAEGIETQAQLDALRAIGCQHGQGYLISPPVDGALIDKWLKTSAPLLPAVVTTPVRAAMSGDYKVASAPRSGRGGRPEARPTSWPQG